MGRKRTCELPFCKGVVEGTRNKRRCDKDRNIHLHQVISKNVKKIMKYLEGCEDFTANDVNRDLFKARLDKNEKGSMYRLFQAMVREGYLLERGKRGGLKVYSFAGISVDQPEVHVEPEKPVAVKVASSRLRPEEVLLGKLREFVHTKSGQWNHDDWMWLVNRADIREFGISEADIGRIVEEEKARYWLQRNSA
ncbi:MAG TPA: hypothetical protein DCG57_08500 [Candidatus Riflebacteria bacterium]|nr:MAG: hypothetical protein CVV41_18935 [Candidatus Riflebacteria bacterium HGW-Riflebacteria-1]HAE38664.1 hypothetical protein [Candidatus Riflebacteria bacterium]